MAAFEIMTNSNVIGHCHAHVSDLKGNIKLDMYTKYPLNFFVITFNLVLSQLSVSDYKNQKSKKQHTFTPKSALNENSRQILNFIL